VVRGPEERYRASHPTPEDIGTLIEVSDSTVEYDRREKQPAYARANVPVYWIINLAEPQVEVYSQPKTGRSPSYQKREVFRVDQDVPVVLAGRRVAGFPVRVLFP
jgi:Uma2 family endonuclease